MLQYRIGYEDSDQLVYLGDVNVQGAVGEGHVRERILSSVH